MNDDVITDELEEALAEDLTISHGFADLLMKLEEYACPEEPHAVLVERFDGDAGSPNGSVFVNVAPLAQVCAALPLDRPEALRFLLLEQHPPRSLAVVLVKSDGTMVFGHLTWPTNASSMPLLGALPADWSPRFGSGPANDS